MKLWFFVVFLAVLGVVNAQNLLQPEDVVSLVQHGANNYTLSNGRISLNLVWTGSVTYDYVNEGSENILTNWRPMRWSVVGQNWVLQNVNSAVFYVEKNTPGEVVLWKNMTTSDGSIVKIKYVLKSNQPLKYLVEFTAGNNFQYALAWRVFDFPDGSGWREDWRVKLNFNTPHYFDFGDLYNMTNNQTGERESYWEIEETSVGNSFYEMLVNISKSGNLPVGQKIVIDPELAHEGSKACYASAFTGTNDCGDALDSDNVTTYWSTNSATGGTYENWTVDLNGTYAYNVTNFDWLSCAGCVGAYYQNLQVFSSDDNFSTQTFRGGISGNAQNYRVLNFTSGVIARYWRLAVNSPIGDGANGYAGWIGIYGTTNASIPNVTINAPANRTYLQNWVLLNFTYTSPDSASLQCYRNLDGVLTTLTPNATNNTPFTNNMTGLGWGNHNVSVLCEEHGINFSSSSINFSTAFYSIHGYSNLNDSFESNSTLHGIYGFASSMLINVSARLVYNNTPSGYYSGDYNGTDWVFNGTYALPLVATNASFMPFYWNITITYSNGTNQSFSDSTFNERILWAYYPTVLNFTYSSLSEGATNNLFLFFEDEMNLSLLTASAVWNSTYYGLTDYATYYATSVTAPSVAGAVNVTGTGTINVSYGSSSFNRTTSPAGFTVLPLNLTIYCNGTNYLALNYSLWNEVNTTTGVNASWSFTFDIHNALYTFSKNLSFNVSNTQNVSVCINTNFSGMTVNSFQSYDPPGFAFRWYFLLNTGLYTNITHNISVYTLPSASVKLFFFTFQDSSTLPLSNDYVQIQRYYVENNTFGTVAMLKLDVAGQANTYLEPNNVFYRFVLYDRNGNVVGTVLSQQLSCDSSATSCSVTLKIAGDAGVEYFTYNGKVATSCTFNPVTFWLVCTVVDTSGTFGSYTLKVVKLGVAQHTQVCDTTQAGASVTLLCFANETGQYSASLVGVGSPPSLLWSQAWNVGTITNWLGASGLFPTMLIMFSLFGVAIVFSPAVAVFLSAFGLVLAGIFGFIVADVYLISAVVVLMLIVGWRLRK